MLPTSTSHAGDTLSLQPIWPTTPTTISILPPSLLAPLASTLLTLSLENHTNLPFPSPSNLSITHNTHGVLSFHVGTVLFIKANDHAHHPRPALAPQTLRSQRQERELRQLVSQLLPRTAVHRADARILQLAEARGADAQRLKQLVAVPNSRYPPR
ncbi:hypothetical protein ARSEF1564_010122 [Beauveria bassiana]